MIFVPYRRVLYFFVLVEITIHLKQNLQFDTQQKKQFSKRHPILQSQVPQWNTGRTAGFGHNRLIEPLVVIILAVRIQLKRNARQEF